MEVVRRFAGVLLVALFAAGVMYLLFVVPELCARDAAPRAVSMGSQPVTLSRGRITVLHITGLSADCVQNGRRVTLLVQNHAKRKILLPGRSYDVGYAATRYPNGREIRVISRIYGVIK